MIEHLTIPQYLLESSFCLVVFYLFYHAFLRKETYFQLNRAYLILSALFALFIPIVHIDFSKASHISGADTILPFISGFQDIQFGIHQTITRDSNILQISLADLISGFYVAGIFLMTLKLGSGLFKLFGIINRSPKLKDVDHTLLISNDVPAASFFSYIFWKDKHDKSDPVQRTIMDHEMVHVRQWHSLDVIVMEIMVIIKWFNPLIYLFRNSLKQTHEFIADKYVTEKLGDKVIYANILLANHTVTNLPPATNHFYGHIKERVQMLSAKKSKWTHKIKFLAAIPIACMLLSLFSFDLSDRLPQPIKKTFQNIESSMMATAETNVINLSLDGEVEKQKFYLQWGKALSLVLTQRYETQDLVLSYSRSDLNNLLGSYPVISQGGKEMRLQIDTLEVIKNNKKMSIEISDLKNEDTRKFFIDSLSQHDQIKVSFKSFSDTDSLKVNLHLNLDIHDKSVNVWSFKEDLPVEIIKWGDKKITFEEMITNHGRRLNIDNIVTVEDLNKMLDHKFEHASEDGQYSELPSTYEVEVNVFRTRNNKLASISMDEIQKSTKKYNATDDLVYMTSYYHGDNFQVVEDTWSQSLDEFYTRKEEFKNWLLTANNGDLIALRLTPKEKNLKSFEFNLRYRDYNEAISAPFPMNIPRTSTAFENFQIVMNEVGKSYVRLDAKDDRNKRIIEAYKGTESYEIIDIKDFKTKNRIWESKLPKGNLEIGDITDLNLRRLDIFRMNEHYSDSNELVRMSWGKMVSMPNIGNYSLKEFHRSSKEGLRLYEGNKELNLKRYDLVFIPESGKIQRIRTDKVNTQELRKLFQSIEKNTSIYVDNIVLDVDDQFMYYPYNFVFTME